MSKPKLKLLHGSWTVSTEEGGTWFFLFQYAAWNWAKSLWEDKRI